MTNLPINPFKAQSETLIDVDQTTGGHRLFLHQPVSGITYEVTDFAEDIEYSYDYKTPWEELNVMFYDVMTLSVIIAPGDFLILNGPRFGLGLGPPGVQTKRWVPFAEIVRAQVVSVDEEISDTGSFRVKCKTMQWLLQKNVIPYRMPSGTLSARLRFLEGQGYLDLDPVLLETSHVLPATRGGIESIWEDIVYDIGETNRVENKKYALRLYKGKFFIEDVSNQPYKLLFEVGGNLFSMTKTRSIEDLYNEIYIISNDDSVLNETTAGDEDPSSLKQSSVGFARNAESQFFMGRHIKLIKEDPGGENWQVSGQAQADYWLKKLSKIQVTADLDTYNVCGLRYGDQVLIYEPVTDTVGVFWVKAGQHKIVNGDAVMQLTVDFDSVTADAVRDKVKANLSIFAKIFGADGAGLDDLTAEERQAAIDRSGFVG